MVENALYIRINENTKEVLQCLNSAIDEILETDILYIQNAAPCYKIQVLDSQGYPLYIYEDSQLIPVTEDQRFKFHMDDLKTAKLEEIKAEYEAERSTRNKGIDSITLGVKIDCREKDVLNIQSIVYVYGETGTAPSFYKAYDNSEVPATGDDFKNVLNELIAAQLAMWQHKNDLSKQIAAATTPEQIKSIKWSW